MLPDVGVSGGKSRFGMKVGTLYFCVVSVSQVLVMLCVVQDAVRWLAREGEGKHHHPEALDGGLTRTMQKGERVARMELNAKRILLTLMNFKRLSAKDSVLFYSGELEMCLVAKFCIHDCVTSRIL